MNLNTALKLGRVSNLPTVWSNVLAGVTLANANINPVSTLMVLLAMSLVYTAGMYFNDVFDADYDRQHRPDRPIPAKQADLRSVIVWATAMLLLALVLLSINVLISDSGSWYAVLSSVVLCTLVLLYDWRHKTNPFGPLIMGACRGLVYITASFSVSAQVSWKLGISALCLTAWVIGLTMVAKQKNIFGGFVLLNASVIVILLIALNEILSLQQFIIFSVIAFTLIYVFVFRWKNDPYWNSVTLLIASICLLDALVIISVTGAFNGLAMTAVGLFLLTLVSQRVIQGS